MKQSLATSDILLSISKKMAASLGIAAKGGAFTVLNNCDNLVTHINQ